MFYKYGVIQVRTSCLSFLVVFKTYKGSGILSDSFASRESIYSINARSIEAALKVSSCTQ